MNIDVYSDVTVGALYLFAAAECELRARLGVLLGRGSWLTELNLSPCNKEDVLMV